jgi:hypothetical protein
MSTSHCKRHCPRCLPQALALAAPAAALAAFRPWVDQALSRPQDVDRPATLAAVEALSGLLAAGAPFAGAASVQHDPDPQSIWTGWHRWLTQKSWLRTDALFLNC